VFFFFLGELNFRSGDSIMKLFVFNSVLKSKNNFKSFKVNAICKLIENLCPEDFDK